MAQGTAGWPGRTLGKIPLDKPDGVQVDKNERRAVSDTNAIGTGAATDNTILQHRALSKLHFGLSGICGLQSDPKRVLDAVISRA
jgi:hypothetical protein